jgi:hypothetical protein
VTEREKLLARVEELAPGCGMAELYADKPIGEIMAMIASAEEAERNTARYGHLGAVWMADAKGKPIVNEG